MMSSIGGAESVRGTVKWFDPVKGFGFITSEDASEDILLHANVLRNHGQSSVADGSLIEVHVQATPRGLQATEIVFIRPPDVAIPPHIADLPEEVMQEIANAPVRPARVKWFDKAKGFGFANIFSRPEDVFIHVEVLRQSGLGDLQAGEAVGLRVAKGKRGCMAVQVLAWDTVQRGELEGPVPCEG